MSAIRVLVTGACGKMGREVVRAVKKEEGLLLVGAVDRSNVGEDIGSICGIGDCGVKVSATIKDALQISPADVMVDFTVAEAASRNVREAILNGIRWVVGTTGIAQSEIDDLMELSRKAHLGGVMAPNFAIGAVLMMSLSKVAARYMRDCEIIELHHDRKIDAPSGTAKATAKAISQEGAASRLSSQPEPYDRGGVHDGIRVHSVRLPGFVAHQEVIFGGPGQVLTIRHDSMGRESFMPGVMMAVRKVMEIDVPVFGLDKAMGLDI